MNQPAVQNQNLTVTKARYALIFKTYAWDDFIARQAQRLMQSAPGGHFYVSLDESHGPIHPANVDRVVRVSRQAMVLEGWPDRCEKGSFFWWNADYPHYDFFAKYPDYDYYVFVEYDALVLGSVDLFVERMAELDADFAALPVREAMENWNWTAPHCLTYPRSDVRGCLMCISGQSRRALQALQERRLAMVGVTFWPSAEVFLPTEAERGGLRTISLEEIGDISRYGWRPPYLEGEAIALSGQAFVHPVYDRKRYVRWTLESGPTLRMLVARDGAVRSGLARLPLRSYLVPWLGAIGRALFVAARFHAERLLKRQQGPYSGERPR